MYLPFTFKSYKHKNKKILKKQGINYKGEHTGNLNRSKNSNNTILTYQKLNNKNVYYKN